MTHNNEKSKQTIRGKKHLFFFCQSQFGLFESSWFWRNRWLGWWGRNAVSKVCAIKYKSDSCDRPRNISHLASQSVHWGDEQSALDSRSISGMHSFARFKRSIACATWIFGISWWYRSALSRQQQRRPSGQF